MQLKRKIINSLDRSGMRWILAAAGSSAARRISGTDVALFYDDDLWVRRVGDAHFGDKESFRYFADDFRDWPGVHRIWLNDPVDFWFHGYMPEPGDVIVDVGAGFGNDALAFARAVGPEGRVIAIEAHPGSVGRLEKTVKWNDLANTTVVPVAAGDSEGTVRISGDGDNVENSIVDTAAEIGHEVPLRRLDDILAEFGIDRVDLLKMNIEGAETPALKGMSEYLRRTRHVVIACHDFRTKRGESEFFRTLDDVAAMLTGAGFELSRRLDDDRPYVRDMIYGTRKPDA